MQQLHLVPEATIRISINSPKKTKNTQAILGADHEDGMQLHEHCTVTSINGGRKGEPVSVTTAEGGCFLAGEVDPAILG